jgi:hypothetical protein
MSRADEYRQNAVECHEQAAKSIAPHDKQQWLKIAEHWVKLAEATEQSEPDDWAAVFWRPCI